MAYTCENIRFGSFEEPISVTSNRYDMTNTVDTLQNNFVHGCTFENPSPNILFGSFSQSHTIPCQIPISAPPHVQSPSSNTALCSFFTGQHNNGDRNSPFTTSYLGVHARTSDLPITLCPTFQQKNVGGVDSLVSLPRSDSFPITYTQIEKNNHSSSNGFPEIWVGINHTKSSLRSGHNDHGINNKSRKRGRSTKMMHGSSSGSQRKKRVLFRFNIWTYEEQRIMDRELEKCTPSSILDTCKMIAIFLPEKSIRDVAMYIKWLINHGKAEDIWDWDDNSPRRDLRDYTFYLPDNPNDPDFVNIRKMLNRGVEDSRG